MCFPQSRQDLNNTTTAGNTYFPEKDDPWKLVALLFATKVLKYLKRNGEAREGEFRKFDSCETRARLTKDQSLSQSLRYPCPAERATGAYGIIRFNSIFHWQSMWAWAVEPEVKGTQKWTERQRWSGFQVVIKRGKSNILPLNATVWQSLERKFFLILPKRKRYRLKQQGTQDKVKLNQIRLRKQTFTVTLKSKLPPSRETRIASHTMRFL